MQFIYSRGIVTGEFSEREVGTWAQNGGIQGSTWSWGRGRDGGEPFSPSPSPPSELHGAEEGGRPAGRTAKDIEVRSGQLPTLMKGTLSRRHARLHPGAAPNVHLVGYGG